MVKYRPLPLSDKIACIETNATKNNDMRTAIMLVVRFEKLSTYWIKIVHSLRLTLDRE